MKKVIIALCLAALSTAPYAAAKRSTKARHDFMRQVPCPATVPHTKYTCPGFVIDHVKPLACGGLDRPSNMQWQTVAEAKAKDKWELKGCKL